MVPAFAHGQKGKMSNRSLRELWKSVTHRYDLFPGTTPPDDARNLQLARVGVSISVALIALMGAAEIGFVAFLLWRGFL